MSLLCFFGLYGGVGGEGGRGEGRRVGDVRISKKHDVGAQSVKRRQHSHWHQGAAP